MAAALSVSACKTTVREARESGLPDGIYSRGRHVLIWSRSGRTLHDGAFRDNRRKITNGIPHEVALGGFVISSKPVSQALWTAVMGNNPSSVQNPDAPADMVSWNDAVKFLGKLNKATGKIFILPTEAQWEMPRRFRTVRTSLLSLNGALTVMTLCLKGPRVDEFSSLWSWPLTAEGPAGKDGKVVRTVWKGWRWIVTPEGQGRFQACAADGKMC